MFKYNTTFLVDKKLFEEWEKWVKEIYKPAIKSIVPNSASEIYEVLGYDNEEHRTISVQWKASTPDEIDKIHQSSVILFQEIQKKYGDKILTHSSIFKLILDN